MTSLRKLRRRALAWQRWIAHFPPGIAAPPAAVRALEAVTREQVRRERERCCCVGRDPHAGPCARDCGWCFDDCPDCDDGFIDEQASPRGAPTLFELSPAAAEIMADPMWPGTRLADWTGESL